MQNNNNVEAFEITEYQAAPTGWSQTKTSTILLVAIVATLAVGLGMFIGIYCGNLIQAKPIESKTTIEPKPDTEKTSPTVIPTLGTTTTPKPLKWMDQPCLRTRQCPKSFSDSPVILVSLDGFRAEYLLRNFTPTLGRLTECGTHATHMRSVYPTMTFPNHYTIATGLYPVSHGIVDNSFYDPEFRARFSVGSAEAAKNRWWWGEPIWNTVEKQGKKAATFFWPGSDVDIQDMRPSYYKNYSSSVPYEERVNQILAWLDLPKAYRPSFFTLYFEEPDKAGHEPGPDTDYLNERLTYVDGYLEMLMDGLLARNLHACVNLIVVADHGMAPHHCDRREFLQDYIILRGLYVDEGPNVRIDITDETRWPDRERVWEDVVCRSTHYDAYLREDVPKRYHYSDSRRLGEVIIDVEEEWLVARRPDTYTFCEGGNHGWDARVASMHAIFVAHGPSFQRGTISFPFQNIEVYNLLCELLNLQPASNNGTWGSLHHMLNYDTGLQPPPYNSVYDEWNFPADEDAYNDIVAEFKCDCDYKDDEYSMYEIDSQLHLDENEIAASIEKFAPWGLPGISLDRKPHLMHQSDYLLAFSKEFYLPIFAAYIVDKEFTVSDNSEVCLRGDVRLPVPKQLTCDDWYNDDMASTEIHPYRLFNPSTEASKQVLYSASILTNIVPFHTGFDSVWTELHSYLSQWASKLGRLHIITGPVFDYNHDELFNDHEELQYVYNGSKIPLPTHYFLIVSRCRSSEHLEDCSETDLDVIGFVIPHKPEKENCKLTQDYLFTHTASVRDIENLTGLSLYPYMNFYDTMQFRLLPPLSLWDLELPDPPTTEPPPGMWIEQPCVEEMQCPEGFSEAPLIVVSFDGFRAEYLLRNVTPYFTRMQECGTVASHMQCAYPTKTFTNHYTIATGLYPESNGLIDNSMYDPVLDANFSMGSSQKFNNAWYLGEPFWNTVEKHGKKSAHYFWVGTDVDIQDIRPYRWYTYDNGVPNNTRVNQILRWLDYPADKRPDFFTLYFEEPDSVGHDYGPDSDEVTEELQHVDAVLGLLMEGLYQRGLHTCVNVIVVSDHGMGPISCDRRVFMRDYVYDTKAVYIYQGPNSRIRIHYSNYTQDTLMDAVGCKNEHYDAYRKQDVPKRYHYSNSQRIDDVVLDVKEDWLVAREPSTYTSCNGGNHGWDERIQSMHAIFVGYGSNFKVNYKSEPFPSIELYNLFAELMQFRVDSIASNNGTWGSLAHMLRNHSELPRVEKGRGHYNDFVWPETEAELENRREAANCNCSYEFFDMDVVDSQLNISVMSPEANWTLALHTPWGSPRLEMIPAGNVTFLLQKDYILGYSEDYLMPLWTSTTINQGESLMKHLPVCVRGDVRLDDGVHPSCTDYSNPDVLEAAIKMGLLYSPRSNTSIENIYDAAILTNVVPFYSDFVNGTWAEFLDTVSDWAAQTSLNVITGPVFDHNHDGLFDALDTVKFIHNGSNIPLPSHYFAIVSRCTGEYTDVSCGGEPVDTMAFIIPHKSKRETCQTFSDYLINHAASVRDVELITGLRFYTDLDFYESLKFKLLAVSEDRMSNKVIK